jgi:putative cell wall-binding protein
MSVQVRRGLPPETETELARLQPHKIIILGGTGVVSPTIEALATYLS